MQRIRFYAWGIMVWFLYRLVLIIHPFEAGKVLTSFRALYSLQLFIFVVIKDQSTEIYLVAVC